MSGSNNDQRPIVIRKVKRVQAAAHHGGAWKVAYADFVTAMMAFFMLLWLLANQDQVQLKGLAEYFSLDSASEAPAMSLTSEPGQQAGLGGRNRRAQGSQNNTIGEITAEAGEDGASRGGTANIPEAALRVMAEELLLAINPPSTPPTERQSAATDSTRDGMRIHLMDSDRRSMFRGPTAELNDYARQTLSRVARALARTSVQVAIEGHTDSSGGQADANWRLSSDRAHAARTAMIAAGLPADRFSEIVGKAGAEPIYPDRPHLPENRRITVVLIGEPSALPRDASFKF